MAPTFFGNCSTRCPLRMTDEFLPSVLGDVIQRFKEIPLVNAASPMIATGQFSSPPTAGSRSGADSQRLPTKQSPPWARPRSNRARLFGSAWRSRSNPPVLRIVENLSFRPVSSFMAR